MVQLKKGFFEIVKCDRLREGTSGRMEVKFSGTDIQRASLGFVRS